MSSTLACNKSGSEFDCRLITDGKRIGQWTTNDIEIESDRSIEIENTPTLFIANSSENIDCHEIDGKLSCKVIRTGRGISWEEYW